MEEHDERLLLNELHDLYSAEKQITRALPKLAKKTTNEDLRAAFETHLQETEGQIERLDRVFELLGKKASAKTCHGMQGVLQEGEEVLEEIAEGDIRDAALISAAQRVEHYEIAAYGSVRTYAQLLGQKEVAQLLQETLDEEGETDKKLTQLAKKINPKAESKAA